MASLNTYSAPGPLYGVDELSCMPVKSAGIVTRTLIRPTSTKLRCGGVELGNFVWIYFTARM